MGAKGASVKHRRVGAALGFVAFLSACGGSPSSPTPTPTQPSAGAMSATAQAYLEQLLSLMRLNSVNRYKIDWTSFRQSVYDWTGAAQTVHDVVVSGGIPTALRLLDDHHSYFIRSDGTTVWNPVPLDCYDTRASAVAVPGDIGYVKVGSTSDLGDPAVQFAAAVQAQIKVADNDRILGWLVDLRGNGGGNMWPMIAGIGPVLGDGLAGAFIDPEGNVSRWGYAAGASWSGDADVVAVPAPYRLLHGRPRVAVLTDCHCASSGEAVVIAFRGRPDARSFGTPTHGVSTAVKGFPLSDGSTLALTVSVMADRTLVPYGNAVVPDEVIGDPGTTVQRAIEWLRGQ